MVSSPVVEDSVVPLARVATRHFIAGRPILPEWTRYAWASMAERGWWEPYLRQASRAWREIERWSVADGVRSAAWITVAPDQLTTLTMWAARYGLIVQARERVSLSSTYTSTGTPLQKGDQWQYRVLLLRQDHATEAPSQLTDNALGSLLGFPECCRKSFDATWGSGQVDSTWDQYANGSSADGPAEANMLWRWLFGLRLVPHLPCSFTCPATVELGRQMREVGKRHGFTEEIGVIDEVLRWPVKWSAVNGIAEIVGPCVKISTRTDWSPERRRFNREGPYNRPDPSLWADNRFKDAGAMHASHITLLSALSEHTSKGARVLDLGCGNGLLLKRLRIRRPDITLAGLDSNAEMIQRAGANLAHGTWRVGRIQDLQWPSADVVLVSVRHLLDMPEEDRTRTVEALHGRTIFAYGYSDCFESYGPLPQMCQKAGLADPVVLAACSHTQVGLIRETI